MSLAFFFGRCKNMDMLNFMDKNESGPKLCYYRVNIPPAKIMFRIGIYDDMHARTALSAYK